MSIHGVVEKNYQPGFQYTPLTDLLVQHPCYVVASHGPLDLTRSDFLIPPLKFIHIPVITEIMGSMRKFGHFDEEDRKKVHTWKGTRN